MDLKNIHIPRPEELKRKIDTLKKDGIINLHIVSDFDKTLTTAFIDKNKVQSSYSLIRDGNYLSAEYVKEAYALHAKYYPFEIDPKLALNEKCKKMDEWWSEHWELMIRCGININVFEDIINKKKVQLRNGSKEFLNTLKNKNIPILIFSSGLGDLIETHLKTENLISKNLHIIANFFQLDKTGRAISYTKPLIHVFNKSEIEVKHFAYHKEIEKRKNVILLGDSLGDLGMTEGIKHNIILRIGFLNEEIEKNIEEYSKQFDVLILNDGTLEYVNKLLKEL